MRQFDVRFAVQLRCLQQALWSVESVSDSVIYELCSKTLAKFRGTNLRQISVIALVSCYSKLCDAKLTNVI